MIWVIVGVVIVVVGLAVVFASRRSTPDGVASFQRQIDALSPEARRSVVDRVQGLDPTTEPVKDPDGDVDGA